MDKHHQRYNEFADRIIARKGNRVLFRLMKSNGKEIVFKYSQINKAIANAKKQFNSRNIVEGNRIAVVAEHSPFALFTDFVLAYIGIKAVLIDASLPVDDIKRLIQEADVSGIILSPTKFDVISGEDVPVPVFKSAEDFTYRHIEGTPEKNTTVYPLSADDVIAIIYSSGTTGVTKGVEITYRSILYTTKWCHDYDIVTTTTRHLNVIPANHIAGYSTGLACILLGSEMGFIDEISSAALLNAMKKFNPRNFIMIPKVYEVMKEKITSELEKQPLPVKAYAKFAMSTCSFVRKRTGYKLRALTKPIWKKAFGDTMLIVGSGTAPCKKEIVEFYLDLGMNFMDVYGSTECGVPISSTNVFEKYPVSGSGKVTELEYVKILIAEPDKDGVGEVRIKTKMMMKGYFKDPELTKAAFDENGYFRTGDLGFVDKEDNLHIIGRIKESIVLKNGKKVSPADVDERYKAVAPDFNLAACGIPDKDGCDEIHLFIESENHSAKELERAIADIKAVSASETIYKRLSGIHIIEKLPTTSVGKVKRYLLKGMADRSDKVEVTREAVYQSDEKLLDILKKYIPSSDSITSDSSLRGDLLIDSLSMFEICSDVQEAYGVDITCSITNDLTVRELEQLINGDKTGEASVEYDISDYPQKKTAKDIGRLVKFAKFSDKVWDIKCFGLENLPFESKYILCPNHESHLDTMWIVSALYLNGINIIKRCSCMGAEYVMRDKALGLGFRALGGIPVDRTGNTAPALKRACEYINDNNDAVFMIHPEGTRTRDGKLGEFKNGAAALAIDTCVPIIPVCINGAREIFPPDKKTPRITGKLPIEIHFGKPIYPDGKTADELTTEIREFISSNKNRWNNNGK